MLQYITTPNGIQMVFDNFLRSEKVQYRWNISRNLELLECRRDC